MGEHRCFSSKITESDDFLDLPVTAQNLYFHLNMHADDRGFVDNPRSVMRMCGASNGDAQALLSAKFMLGFDGKNVLLVKHWKIHNYIRKDRFNESAYVNLLKSIYYDENKGYSTNIEHQDRPVLSTTCQPLVNQVTTNCQPVDNHLSTTCLTQDKLSKDRKKEEKEERNPSFSLSYTDDDFIGLDIPEPTKEDLRFLRESSRDLYKAGVDKYRWRAQG